jgi:hypothetical protein
VPAAYCPLLLELDPVSFKYQPMIVRLFVVPVLASVSKFWVDALPKAVRLIEPEPPPSACAPCIGSPPNINAKTAKAENTLNKDLFMPFSLLNEFTKRKNN